MTTTTTTKSNRGFASMDPDRRREIARKGGASVPSAKRSFSQSADLAARAARVGGSTSRRTVGTSTETL